MSYYYILLTSILLLFSGSSYSQPLEVDSNFTSVLLTTGIKYLEDTGSEVNFKNIQNYPLKNFKGNSINWGHTNSTYWLHTQITSTLDEEVEVFFINKNHYLESFTVYLSMDSTLIDSFNIGSVQKNKSFPIPIVLVNKNTITITCKVSSNSVLRVPIYLYSKKELDRQNQLKHLLTGTFMGVFLFLLGLSLFIAIALREKIYLVFCLFILTYFYYFLGYEDLLPKLPVFNHYNFLLKSTVALIPLIQFCYIYFSKLFFDLRGKVKWIHNIFISMQTISIINFILFAFNYKLANNLLFFTPSIFGSVLFALSIYVWIKLDRKFLRFYVLATFLFITGVTLHSLANSGTIDSKFLAFNSIKIGYLLLLSIFSYALTDRFLLFSRNFTNILNEKVEERTTELESALTKLKTKQHQLVQSEKMVSIGILTSGLAHELNNPLNFINGGLELIKAKNINNALINDEETLNSLNYIQAGFDRATEIVNSILEFSDGISDRKVAKNIEEIIDRALFVLRPKTRPEIDIRKNYSVKSELAVDNSKMHQVFLCILDNAIYYANEEKNAPVVSITTMEKSTYLQVEIFNTGKPIEPENLTRIFDPFFTTKDIGKGIGLGLSSALNIIQDHGGSITLNNLTNGVSFIIKLPLNAEA